MTDDLLERLAREAIDEARGMAAAEGYFSARIDVKIDRTADPVAVTLSVDPGAPTHITTVRIVVTGPAPDAPLGAQAIARLTRDWGLPEGSVFRQAAWQIAKERALATLAGSPYAAARMTKAKPRSIPSAEVQTSSSNSPADRRSTSASS
jgi:translocation and assembly module TamA